MSGHQQREPNATASFPMQKTRNGNGFPKHKMHQYFQYSNPGSWSSQLAKAGFTTFYTKLLLSSLHEKGTKFGNTGIT